MVDTKQFNPLPLLSVKAGLDSSMAQISSELELYFAEGWAGNQHLRLAPIVGEFQHISHGRVQRHHRH